MDSGRLTDFIAAELSSFFPANEAEVPSLLADELGLDKAADAWPLPATSGLEGVDFSFGVICLTTVARGSDTRNQQRFTKMNNYWAHTTGKGKRRLWREGPL